MKKKHLQKQITALEKAFTSPGMSGDAATARMFGPIMQSNTGIRVTPWTALGSSTVFACVRALSEDMARLPLCVEHSNGLTGWAPAPNHPLTALFRRPNKWQNAFDFKAYLVSCYALRGNGYAVIIRDSRGNPTGLVPISPDRTQVMLSENGNLYYSILHQLVNNDQQIVVPADDMIHLRGISMDGYTGISPIMVGQETIGLSLAAQTQGAKFFANGASLTGVLESPEKLSNEAAARMASSWKDVYTGIQNAGRVAVLEEGVKFNSISMSQEDAQYLETRQFQVIDICRLFRVPPHKAMCLDDAHYANLEQMNQQYIDDALLPICLRLEQEMRYKLLFTDEQVNTRISFNFDALLRSDQETRYKSYLAATGGPILTINEARAMENLAPKEGGDVIRSQIQNIPINQPNPDAGESNNGQDNAKPVQNPDDKRQGRKRSTD